MSTCEVRFRSTYQECGEPAGVRVEVGCVHEHVKTGWACRCCLDAALRAPERNGCRTCFDLPNPDAHECRVLIKELVA